MICVVPGRMVLFPNSGDAEAFQRGLYVGTFEHDRAPDAIERNHMATLPITKGTTRYRQQLHRFGRSQIQRSGFDVDRCR